MIPNIIHQIWIQGYESIPSELRKYHENCLKINYGFKNEFWDNDRIRNFLKNNFEPEYLELYDKYKIYAQKADFARYAILKIHGGIYLDMDMVCRKNLGDFLGLGFFFTAYKLKNVFTNYLNGVIGSRPNHPVFDYIFKNMFLRQNDASNVTNSTGTKLFRDSITEYTKNNPTNDISLIDSKYLHPCNLYNDKNCPYTCTDCYIAHTNYSSWAPHLKLCKIFFENKYLIFIIIIIIFIILILLWIKYKFNKS
ncbi:putative glycosyltransferase [Acanthamoeba castellanii mimivirus]|uniref:Uncharacterized glycosyltransferase L373 n=5 Tax=Mimivirus TaxID=315393 RepID=YL373_MIMIV|nr:uncharacterized glycosyltransferase [Acanthamoeba polyphaga mimivirus]Q5UQW4.1 RecName: Full=Uncharacterized glycosyltransferase L373 [Acanthamoeba polyphaga mimivirus]AEQ60562.1 putative glycosyltransferase [Acanthamoeba castellanii mamavirus]AHA45490.1 putative glycosyltransferase [Hirudovirus strain Sangsue]AHJ40078.2 glycosyltransferase [Samba virus]ALR83953.1 putative glycosyltransferase [Niemeyer virus]AMZ02818.1 putative glycosyltransferase [Mimivirus Bombay]EJN40814.1 putative gly